MQDLNPAYMQARTVLRQLTKHLSPLSLPSSVTPGVLHLPAPPVFNASDRSLVGAWKVYLKWEESNPLEIEEGAKSTLINRIQTVYRKAVISMRFFSEIWYMAHVWLNGVGKFEEAIAMLKGGIEANPSRYSFTTIWVSEVVLICMQLSLEFCLCGESRGQEGLSCSPQCF
jgi:cleavage stimulation factor subunit 3